jgi:hypothetical protein
MQFRLKSWADTIERTVLDWREIDFVPSFNDLRVMMMTTQSRVLGSVRACLVGSALDCSESSEMRQCYLVCICIVPSLQHPAASWIELFTVGIARRVLFVLQGQA